MEVIDCEQNTEEWYRERLGLPTASMFSTVLANGRDGNDSKSRMTYMLKLIGERITGEQADNYSNSHMQRGHEMEDEALSVYQLMSDNVAEKVGFIKNHGAGASPDAIVGANGLVEIKTKLPHIHLAILMDDEVPLTHIPQVQGQIWIAEREWCDFVSYWRKLRPFITRVYRDDAYIKNVLWPGINKFNDELEILMEKLK